MRKSASTLWPYLRRYKRGLALGMGALTMKDLLAATLPVVMRKGIDSLTQGFQLETVLWLAGALVAISALKGLFQYWMRVIIIGISRDIEYEMRNDLFARLISLSSDFYARFRTGDIMARSTNDLNAVRMMLGPGIMYWTETSLTLVLSVSVMLYVDWPLTLAALMPAPLVSFAVIYFGGKIHQRFEKIQRMFSDISSRVQENFAGARLIRAYVQEEAEMEHFRQLNLVYIDQNLRLVKTTGVFMPLLTALIAITFLIVLWVGGARLLAGKITLGSFVMFNTYMGMLIWPMIAMGWVVNLMQRGTASLARINEMLDETPSIAPPANPLPLAGVRGEIEFRNVDVRYGEIAALQNVNFKIPAGSTVAIVGRTGCGKSSLVQLIPRLNDPQAGEVLLDGVNVKEYDPAEVRLHVGMVPQETFLFSATIAENIAFGVESATREDIVRAANMAGLEPDLASFPLGLDTVSGERGITLSGGQKQRTAIARALMRDPKILILDDALASVDTLTEERILRELATVMSGRTTILISHRVSTVRHADCIYVLDHGRIVEQGTHDQLLAAGGYYAGLHSKQMLEEELEAI
jgi:ATP-binding cassette subfamily B multidrug efflux pump